MNPDRIRFVLLRTRHGKNLGAVARALTNFGLSNLVLADLGDINWSDVNQTAVRSKEITESAQRVSSVADAVAGCAWVVGTTIREVPGQRNLHPRAVAERLAELSKTHEVALVFGSERNGLSNRDLLQCHDVSIIPTVPELPSLNLAQAVLVYAWELFTLIPERDWPNHRSDSASPTPAPRATETDYRRLETALRAYLARVGFRDPDRPRHGVIDLMHSLKRAGLTPREANVWEAVLTSTTRGRDE